MWNLIFLSSLNKTSFEILECYKYKTMFNVNVGDRTQFSAVVPIFLRFY